MEMELETKQSAQWRMNSPIHGGEAAQTATSTVHEESLCVAPTPPPSLILYLASFRARGPILVLVLVALAKVHVHHVRPVQSLSSDSIDPAQAGEIKRERLVELGLAYRVKRLAARSLARPPVTGTGTEQRRRKTQTHLQHLDLHARGRRRVYPAFPLVVLLSATKSTNQ